MGHQEFTHEMLLETVRYEPETGMFFWLVNRGSAKPGKAAGYFCPAENRVKVRLFGELRTAHRLAWFYMTGRWPEHDIDHIDGDGSNNCWTNLRDVPHARNMENSQKARRNSSTGYLGVVPNREKFMARITVGRRKVHLGSYGTATEAHAAYLEAKRRLHEGCAI